MNVVEIKGLRKTYRDFWRRPLTEAVKGISFSAAPGEVVGIIGPNGSGKSTTIKLLLGLIRASAGSIRVFDMPPDDIRTKTRIGYLPELSYLHPFLTPRETLAYYGALSGLSRAETKIRSEQLLEMVELTQAADRPVGGFSKGMARRVGLAQALINAPELLILDEPTSGLDPEACRDMKDLVLLLKRTGVTILMTSHLLADVEDVCDRVIVLAGGEIQAEGTVGELLRMPDVVRFELNGLTAEQTAQVRAELAERFGTVGVNYPQMSLERYFIDTIRKGAVRRFSPAAFLVERGEKTVRA